MHASTLSRSGVFVARCPLAGMGAVARRLRMSTLPRPVPSHWMVMIADVEASRVTVMDFLPEDPLVPRTAAALLAGGAVPGVCQVSTRPTHAARMTQHKIRLRDPELVIRFMVAIKTHRAHRADSNAAGQNSSAAASSISQRYHMPDTMSLVLRQVPRHW